MDHASALQQYAAALWARIPAGDLAGAADAQRARGSAPGPGRAASESPLPERPAALPASPADRRERPDHAVLGLSALSRAWPAGLHRVLDDFADLLRCADLIWGNPEAGSAQERSARAQLSDRRHQAVHLLSARFYAACRASGVDDDAVEEGAQELASWLGERLYGASATVFAPKRGRFIEDSQELADSPVQASQQVAGVRGLSFGVRREGGSIVRRAMVERIPASGGPA